MKPTNTKLSTPIVTLGSYYYNNARNGHLQLSYNWSNFEVQFYGLLLRLLIHSHLNCDQFRLWGDHGIKKGSTQLKKSFGVTYPIPLQPSNSLFFTHFFQNIRPTSLGVLLVRPKNNLPKQLIFFIIFGSSFHLSTFPSFLFLPFFSLLRRAPNRASQRKKKFVSFQSNVVEVRKILF